MPYPSRIDRKAIIAVARDMIRQHGAAQVSLHKIAHELGVKTPSLYRYVANKNALLRAVNEDTLQQLFDACYAALKGAEEKNIKDALLASALQYRHFAHEHPQLYSLLFSTTQPEMRPEAISSETGILPLQKAVALLSGADEALTALRGLLALMHGYVVLELADQFQRGGDLQATYRRLIEIYLGALPPRRGE